MNNVFAFPQRPRVEVSLGRDKETGGRVFIFEEVDGHGRDVLSVQETEAQACSQARFLMDQGYSDITWDESTRGLLLGGAR